MLPSRYEGGLSAPVALGSAATRQPLQFALYAALYRLMLLEDQALLVGSIGLFAAPGAIMPVTRRIDRYALGPRASTVEG